MDLSFLCFISLIVVMGGVTIVARRFRLKTFNYLRQKTHNPSLKPPTDIKIGNRLIRLLTVVFIIGLGGFGIYGFISTGQLLTATLFGLFVILAIVTTILVSLYWKDKFDL